MKKLILFLILSISAIFLRGQENPKYVPIDMNGLAIKNAATVNSHPFSNYATMSGVPELRPTFLDLKLYGAEESDAFFIRLIGRNYNVSGAYRNYIQIYNTEIVLVCEFNEPNYTEPSGYDQIYFDEYGGSGITAQATIDWKSFTSGTRYVITDTLVSLLSAETYIFLPVSEIIDNIITTTKVVDDAITRDKVLFSDIPRLQYPFSDTATLAGSDGENLRNTVKDIVLYNALDSIDYYYVYLFRRGHGDFYWRLEIKDKAGTTMCSFNETSYAEPNNTAIDIIELTEQNGSGIRGYASVHWDKMPYPSNNIYTLNESSLNISTYNQILHIEDGSITNIKLADGCLSSNKIKSGIVINPPDAYKYNSDYHNKDVFGQNAYIGNDSRVSNDISENSVLTSKEGMVSFRWDLGWTYTALLGETNADGQITELLIDMFNKYDAKFSIACNIFPQNETPSIPEFSQNKQDIIRYADQCGHNIFPYLTNQAQFIFIEDSSEWQDQSSQWITTGFSFIDTVNSDIFGTFDAPIAFIEYDLGVSKASLLRAGATLDLIAGSNKIVMNDWVDSQYNDAIWIDSAWVDFPGKYLSDLDGFWFTFPAESMTYYSTDSTVAYPLYRGCYDGDISFRANTGKPLYVSQKFENYSNTFVANRQDVSPSVEGFYNVVKATNLQMQKIGLKKPSTFTSAGLLPGIRIEVAKEVGEKFAIISANCLGDCGSNQMAYGYNSPLGDTLNYAICKEPTISPTMSTDSVITLIADYTARHAVIFDGSHPHIADGMHGDIYGYLRSLDSILSFCYQNNIPVVTFNQTVNTLRRKTDPDINIIPSINRDYDKNMIPDGYSNSTAIDNADGIIETQNICWKASGTNQLFEIDFLYGVEKGWNEFGAWTKRISQNDSISITIEQHYQCNGTINSTTFYFSDNDTDWAYKKKTYAINIVPECAYIKITASAANTDGIIKITGCELRKTRH